jgi:uncharacterized protein YoxC
MAEILGVTSAVAGLITLADGIFSRGYELIDCIKDADESIKRVLDEVNSFTGTLHCLKNLTAQLKQGDSNAEPALQVLHLNPCYATLGRIQSIIEKLKFTRLTESEYRERGRLSQRLHWPLNVKKTKLLIDDIQRHKETLTLALGADSMLATSSLLR